MLKEHERIDQLLWGGLRIIQNPRWFCFSVDAVILARLATLEREDRVVDLGTGTGVIPLLLSAREKNIRVTGLEITPEVVDMARRSIALNNLDSKIEIRLGDLREATLLLGRGKFNLVISNPPYGRAGSGRESVCPIKAIARTELKCSLEDVIREASGLLNSHGRFALINRSSRLTDIIFLMRKYRLEPKGLRLIAPLPGKAPNLVFVEGVKDGGQELTVYPSMFIYRESGKYSEEMEKIFSGVF